jgi:hypothetical protein
MATIQKQQHVALRLATASISFINALEALRAARDAYYSAGITFTTSGLSEVVAGGVSDSVIKDITAEDFTSVVTSIEALAGTYDGVSAGWLRTNNHETNFQKATNRS